MTTSNKIFVSPGVYTSERDLSFVAQSVGVTTLGIVGETLTGPAFEPIFITNFDEFQAFFGGTTPEKFVNTQIPKYEAAYIAKAYLQQSNQLFVTRVLGLSGYDAGPSWSITTIANVDPNTIGIVDGSTPSPNEFTVTNSGASAYIINGYSNPTLTLVKGETYTFNVAATGHPFVIKTIDETGPNNAYTDGVTINSGIQTTFTITVVNDGTANVFVVDSVNKPPLNLVRGGVYTFDQSNISNVGHQIAFKDGDGNSYTSGVITTGVLGQAGAETVITVPFDAPDDLRYYCVAHGNYMGNTISVSSGIANGTVTFIVPNDAPSTLFYICQNHNAMKGVINVIDVSISPTPFTVSFTGTTGSSTTVGFTTSFPSEIGNVLTESYTQFDGSTTTINIQLQSEIYSIIQNNALSATTIYYFGSIDDDDYTTESAIYTDSINVYNVDGIPVSSNTFSESTNDPWYYSLFNIDSGDDYEGSSFYTVVSNLSDNGSGNFSGTVSGVIYGWSGTAFSEYNNMVVATLRSRGIATYTDDNGAVYQVTGSTDVGIDSSGIYDDMTKNPYSAFRITGTSIDNTTFAFVTSMQSSDANYISKVFGITNFGKSRSDVPVFVEERYQSLLNYSYNKGYIRGINTSLTYLPDARGGSDPTTIANYLVQYQSSQSPWVVSELRGSTVYRLFKAITIADGNTANQLIKVSIANISFANGTFDLIVRDFYDTDANPVIIEKYTSCSMDTTQNNYVGKKVGSSDGEYTLFSKFIMLELNHDAPIDALPCGFEGFTMRTYSGAKVPFPIYKTSYYFPGEVIFNPPFGTTSGGDNIVISSGDNKRRVYLGISDTVGIDPDYYLFKGYQFDTNICNPSSENAWNNETKGFHMDSGATVVNINSIYSTSGTPSFECGVASFDSEPTDPTSPYYTLNSRKFTFLCQGGFDGWDIYRESRTNSDRFVLGQSGYLNGACVSTRYPNATGFGAFKQITVQDNTTDFANTDYYAYLLGILTFDNPESVNINIFVTPGIDYVNNSNLVESAIDMVENDRADSIYICTTPDYNMFVPTASALQDFIYPQEAVDSLENIGIDSNYTATYYPWVLTRDTVNNTQIYIPSTAEVTKNLALTDNIAFPWFATAGYTRGIVNSIKARKKLTQTDRDTLYQGRINPIATFSDVGTVIFGNKTLQIRESALDRINVRRLLLQARKLISAVAVRLLFEQNDGRVRQDFLNAVNPILDSIRRDRGLHDFRVTISETPEDLDSNQMTGKIFLKPTKALEFIDIEFLITPTGASFENI